MFELIFNHILKYDDARDFVLGGDHVTYEDLRLDCHFERGCLGGIESARLAPPAV
jgi:hypothetical protein